MRRPARPGHGPGWPGPRHGDVAGPPTPQPLWPRPVGNGLPQPQIPELAVECGPSRLGCQARSSWSTRRRDRDVRRGPCVGGRRERHRRTGHNPRNGVGHLLFARSRRRSSLCPRDVPQKLGYGVMRYRRPTAVSGHGHHDQAAPPHGSCRGKVCEAPGA